ncbi:transglutaminase-like cysteine peptidase [Azonexus sp. R2A61]|uniref:transglutaminase-like cysteine peptidase n=1 Tax=Azonexus sp. R2A61 TaxID=2744443 RepID=UPI001F200FC2|nr:transglutaminase-like cysteine peptidase [Azonexus sp. R2A61]
MFAPHHRHRHLIAALMIVCATPTLAAGLVNFSQNLLDYVARQYTSDAPKRLLIWQKLLNDMRGAEAIGAKQQEPKAESLTLRKINTFFNQVPYISDLRHWRQEDYWATPVEMLGSYGGDCEDYSIAKYLSLKDLGLPIDRLRITYVRAKELNESHMVLAYYPTPDGEPLIMDNLIPELRPASQRPDLEPVYSFNDDDLWTAAGVARKGGASNVRLWRELLEKLAREQRM